MTANVAEVTTVIHVSRRMIVKRTTANGMNLHLEKVGATEKVSPYLHG